ncbi:unnamed protein product [Polarella glacialis]|uniref:Uncharacterized protein n=1 Tax=Polarella glacialis TaxID=89957 RepID=A0A813D6S2_POLGL|nr:unnamed protein product [Polarella glacialis]CAE8715539.1 unnamed protein product [Polarella glacialis]
MPEDAQERLQADLQSKLRKLLCKGLGYLDLSDAGTASLLEPALSLMKLLIERFEARGKLQQARAAKQWLRLQGILIAEATTQQQEQQRQQQQQQQQQQQAATNLESNNTRRRAHSQRETEWGKLLGFWKVRKH